MFTGLCVFGNRQNKGHIKKTNKSKNKHSNDRGNSGSAAAAAAKAVAAVACDPVALLLSSLLAYLPVCMPALCLHSLSSVTPKRSKPHKLDVHNT